MYMYNEGNTKLQTSYNVICTMEPLSKGHYETIIQRPCRLVGSPLYTFIEMENVLRREAVPFEEYFDSFIRGSPVHLNKHMYRYMYTCM